MEPNTALHGSGPRQRSKCDAIDEFFRANHATGKVHEAKSLHSSPTFCINRANGKWRLIIISIQPLSLHRLRFLKRILQNNMIGCTMYTALDLVDNYYQLLMRTRNVLLKSAITPIAMPWEWLVIPQGLLNSPATFNRVVTQLLRPHRAYAHT